MTKTNCTTAFVNMLEIGTSECSVKANLLAGKHCKMATILNDSGRKVTKTRTI